MIEIYIYIYEANNGGHELAIKKKKKNIDGSIIRSIIIIIIDFIELQDNMDVYTRLRGLPWNDPIKSD